MFDKGSKAHLIGIKGVGMTALAAILKARGVVVTGSDGPSKFFTDKVLADLQIPITEQFSEANISDDTDAVIASGAYLHQGHSLNNIEVDTAFGKKIPVFLYSQALGIIAKEYKVLAVAGSNGKSTTTAMLGWILEQVKLDPTVVVGTKVNGWESNARVAHSTSLPAGRHGSGQGQRPWMVVEADEYREAFLRYYPTGAIITNIDYDHPDYFKTTKSYIEAFENMALQIQPGGFLVGCGDDTEVVKILDATKKRGVKTYSYGFGRDNEFQITEEAITKQKQCFTIKHKEKSYDLTVPYPGRQYVLNATGAFATAVHLGVSHEKIIEAVATFPGTARRLEILSAKGGSASGGKNPDDCIIIDDYAHHPTAITVTLEGIKKMYAGKTIVALFQPHMFSRTQALLKELAACFRPADVVGIMEIYPSARETSGPVNGKDLAEATSIQHRQVSYLADETAAKQFIAAHEKPGTVIVLMGAGNVNDLVKKS